MDDPSMRPNWHVQRRGRGAPNTDALGGTLTNFLSHPDEGASHVGGRRHFEPRLGVPFEAKVTTRPRREQPEERRRGLKMFPGAGRETEQVIKPPPRRRPTPERKPERQTGARHLQPPKKENKEWGFPRTPPPFEARKDGFHSEAFPGSIGHQKFPDHDSSGKLIDYSLRKNGGIFSKNKVHNNEMVTVSDVDPLPPRKRRPVTPPAAFYPMITKSFQLQESRKAEKQVADRANMRKDMQAMAAQRAEEEASGNRRTTASLGRVQTGSSRPGRGKEDPLYAYTQWTFLGSYRP